jgi:N-acetylmuramoyl-L-alanine amidase
MFCLGNRFFALSLIRGVAPSLWIKSSNITDMDGGDCGIPLIVIDAGHGGMDGGAVGVKGVVEAPLNLAVAQLVEGGLRDRGYRVKMTREDENALGRISRPICGRAENNARRRRDSHSQHSHEQIQGLFHKGSQGVLHEGFKTR